MNQLTFKGRPVPWITRWTSEMCTPGPRLKPVPSGGGRVRLSFEDEQESDRIDDVLWIRERDSPGDGEPMWKDVHSHRQRRCQTEGRCQICGELIEGVIPWLIPAGLAQRLNGNLITDVAPTCSECIPLATMACPHLSRNVFRIVDVRDYRPWGLFGDIIEPVEGSNVTHYQADRMLNSYLGNVMARQMIVELWNFRRRRT